MSFFYESKTISDYRGERTVKEIRTDRVGLAIIAGVIAIILLLSCTVVIGTGRTGIVSVFGKVSEDVLHEGLHFKAPWQKVTKVDCRTQKLEVITEAFSSDLQTVSVNLAVNYSVDPTMSYTIIKSIGKRYEDILVTPVIHEVMKSIIAQYSAENSIACRNEISTALKDGLNEKLNVNGINVKDINIVDFDFNDTYIAAIEAKQVAEQRRLQAQTEQAQLTMEQQAVAERKVIEAEAEAESARVAAEAEAEITRIQADAAAYAGEVEAQTNEKIAASLTAALVEYFKIERWDGELPNVTGADAIITMPDTAVTE